ncbi:hypothetical protein ACZ75_06325 [Massilia sp. NR 4-1]|nr:hypothetical protein ACZ75_06325 [Massilia sp. NR 4-1]
MNGIFGNGAQGSSREAAYINLFNGNVTLSEKDEFLAARSIDAGLTRSYNSQGAASGGFGWRHGPVRRLSFDGAPNAAGSKVTLTDADGSASLYLFDGQRYVSTDGGGAFRTIVYDAGSQQWTWQDNHNDRAGLYEIYDSKGLLQSTCNLGGMVRSYEYTTVLGQDLISVVKNPASGDVTSYAYDARGKLAQISTMAGDKTVSSTTYGFTGDRLTSVSVDLTPENSSDAVVYTTTYGYDAASRVNRITQSDGSVLGFDYDATGRVAAFYDDAGSKTLITYAAGRATVTDPLGYKTTYVSGANGLLSEVIVNDGAAAALVQRSKYFYDASGNLERMSDIRGIETKYTYDKNGNWLTRRDSAGLLVTRRYTANNLLASETSYQVADTDGDNASTAPMTTRYVYNSQNQLCFVLSAEGKVTEYRYDALGLRSAQWQYNDRSYPVSADPALIVSEEALSAWSAGADRAQAQLQEYAYDARGTLTTSTSYTAVGADGKGSGAVVQSYVRDHGGQILSSYAGTRKTADYAYDGLGRVISQTKDDGSTLYTYNGNATTVSITPTGANRPVRSTTSTYDTAGRLLSATETTADAGDSKITNVYDKDGRLHSSTDANGLTSYNFYDQAGRLIFAIDPSRTGTRYVYNSLGQLVQTTVYAIPVPAINMMSSAGVPVNPSSFGTANAYDRHSYISYDSAGRILDTVDVEGYVTRRFYDGASRLIRSTAYIAPLTPAQLKTYATTPVAPTASTVGADRDTYNIYDSDDRLIGTVDADAYLTELRYDADGNVVKKIRYASQVKTPAANTLAGLQISANPAEDRVTEFRYGAGKRLLLQSDSDGSYQKFNYDGAGNVTGIERGTDRMTMARYDAQGRVISELNAEGALRLRQLPPGISLETVWQQYAVDYTYNNAGQRTSVRDAMGNRTLFHYDGHGKLRFTVDALGGISENRYDSNGALIKTVRYAKNIGLANLAQLRGGDTQELQTLVPALRDDTQDQADTFYYDDAGRLLFTVNAGGRVQGLQYNVFGQVAVKVSYNTILADKTVKGLVGGRGKTALAELAGFPNKDVKNAREAVVYDIKGRLRFTINPASQQLGITGYTYNEFGELKDTTVYNRPHDPNSFEGAVDDITRVSSQPAFVQSVESYAYNKRGLRIDTTDALKNHTLTSYNAFGAASMVSKLATANSIVRSSLDISLRTIYDRGGRVLATIDGRGALVYNRYDNSDNLVERIAYANPLSLTTAERATAADIADIAAALTDLEHDQRQRFVYDADNRLTSTLTSQRYDAVAKSTAWSVSSQEYDKRGNVVVRKAYAQHLWLNEAAGFVTGTPAVDEADALTRTSYDALNRAVATATLQRVEGGVKVWSLTAQRYDGFGNIISKIQYATPLRSNDPPADLLSAAASSAADRRTLFSYDSQNRVRLTIDTEGAITQFGYDSRGNVMTETRFAKEVSLGDSIPANFALPASDQDRLIAHEYDLANRLIRTISAFSQTEKRYDMAGNLQSLTYWGEPVRTEKYFYDLNGRLRFTLGPFGLKENRYNALGQLIQTVQYEAAVNLPVFNSAAPTTAAIEAELIKYSANFPALYYQRIQSFEYDAQGNLVKSTDAMQNSESYGYDALGRKTSFTNKLGQTWTYGYDAAGRLVSELSPEVKVYIHALITTMGSWGNGNAARMLTKMEYDALGNLIRREEGVAGEPGRVTEYRYDRVGRQIETILPAAEVDAGGAPGPRNDVWVRGSVKVRYDAFGNAVSNEDVGGKLSYKIYDKLGRVRFAQDALGYVTEYELSSYGEVTTLTRYSQPQRSAAGQTEADFKRDLILDAAQDRSIKSSYDKAGRLLKTVEPLVWSYDQQSITSSMYVEAAKTTEFQYNSFGEVTSEVIYGAAADGTRVGNQKETRYAYDQRGLKVGQLNVTGYSAGATPNGYVTRYAYDAAGNLLQQKEFNADASEKWDEIRPISTAPSNQKTDLDRILNYTYDKNNHRLTETQEMVRFFDAAKGETKGSLTTTTTYDALGRAIKVEDALKNATFTYYDALGRVTAIAKQLNERESKLTEFKLDIYGNAILNIEYAKAALNASVTAPPTVVDAASADNRVTATRFDINGRAMEVLDAVRFAKGEINKTIHYSYDIFGRVAKQWRSVTNHAGQEEISYQVNGYDSLGRLKSVRTPGNRDLVDGKTAVEIEKRTVYNGFGETISTHIRDAFGDRETSYSHYDRAGRVWRSNGEDGIHKVFFYDVYGQQTTLLRSASAQKDALLGLAEAKQALSLRDIVRTDRQYNTLGHVIDVRENAQQSVFRRENGGWVKTTALDGFSREDLIVLANAPEKGRVASLRYRLSTESVWTDALVERLQELDGYMVFSSGGMDAGDYVYELTVKAGNGPAALVASGGLRILAGEPIAQHAQLFGLYLLLFNRAADPGGMNFWMDKYNKGFTLSQIAADMYASKEGKARLPEDRAVLIRQLMAVAKRSPSQDLSYPLEFERWHSALVKAGTDLQACGAVLADMATYYRAPLQKRVDAAINYVITGGGNDQATADRLVGLADTSPDGAIAEGNQAAALDRQRSQLARLYVGLLSRVPDKPSFDARWTALSAGASMESVALEMLKSSEGQSALLVGSGLPAGDAFNRRLVTLAYQNLLGRAPADLELTWELGRLSQQTPDLSHGTFLVALADRVANAAAGKADMTQARQRLFLRVQLGLMYAKAPIPTTEASTVAAYYRAVLASIRTDLDVSAAAAASQATLQNLTTDMQQFLTDSKAATGFTPLDAQRHKLARLYAVLLNRAPDQGGFEFWQKALQSGVSWKDVANSMLNGEGSKDALYPVMQSYSDFIARVYRIAFGRDVDHLTIAPWLERIPFSSRAEVALEIIDAVLSSTKPEDFSSRDLLINKASVGLMYALHLGGNDVAAARQINEMVTATNIQLANQFAITARAQEITDQARSLSDSLTLAVARLGSAQTITPQVIQAADNAAKALAAAKANPLALPMLRAAYLYVGLLNRTGAGRPGLELGGLAAMTLQIRDGATDIAMAQSMLDSDEGKRIFPPENYNAQEYVSQLYRQMLNREPDTGGLAFWTATATKVENRAAVAIGVLNGYLEGLPDDSSSYKLPNLQGRIEFYQRIGSALDTIGAQLGNTATLANEAAKISKDIETRQATAKSSQAAYDTAFKQAETTNSQAMIEVGRLFVGLFNRGNAPGQKAIDISGWNFWARGRIQGVSLASISETFLGADDGKALFPPSQTNQEFIDQLCSQALGRPAQAGDPWLAILNRGERSRAWVAAELISNLTERTAPNEADYLAKARLDQRVLDALKTSEAAAKAEIAIAQRDVDAKLAIKNTADQGDTVAQRKRELDAASRVTLADFPAAEQARILAAPSLALLASANFGTLNRLLVAFNQKPSYEEFRKLLQDLDASKIVLADLLRPLAMPLTDRKAFFTDLYRMVLKREPDEGGFKWWLENNYTNGMTDPGKVAWEFYDAARQELREPIAGLSKRTDFEAEAASSEAALRSRFQGEADGYLRTVAGIQEQIDARYRQAKQDYDAAVRGVAEADLAWQLASSYLIVAKAAPAAIAAAIKVNTAAVAAANATAALLAAQNQLAAIKDKLGMPSDATLAQLSALATSASGMSTAMPLLTTLLGARSAVDQANIERTKLAQQMDADPALANNATALIRVFIALTGRAPTLAELRTYLRSMEVGATLVQATDAMVTAIIGTTGGDHILRVMYPNCVGIAGLPPDAARWLKALETQSRGQVALDFTRRLAIGELDAGSKTYHGKLANAINALLPPLQKERDTPDVQAALLANTTRLRAEADAITQPAHRGFSLNTKIVIETHQVYAQMLGREPTAEEMLTARDIFTKTRSMLGVIDRILASAEGQACLNTTGSAAQYASALFRIGFSREPSAAELTALFNSVNGVGKAKATYDFTLGAYASKYSELNQLTGRAVLMARVDIGLATAPQKLKQYADLLAAGAVIADNIAKQESLGWIIDQRVAGRINNTSFHSEQRQLANRTVDRWGNVLSITDPRDPNWKVVYTYNHSNQQLTQSSGSGVANDPVVATKAAYDQLGRLISTIDARGNGMGYAYDANGNLVKESHADGGLLESAYDLFGNRTYLRRKDTATQKSVQQNYAYDQLGHMTSSFTEAKLRVVWLTNNTASWIKDGDRNNDVHIDADRQLTDSFQYDELGRKISSTDAAGVTSTTEYDLENNVIATMTAGRYRVATTYDGMHNRRASLDANGMTMRWTVENYGAITSYTDLGGNITGYTYDGTGQKLSMQIKRANGAVGETTYGYEDGRLVRVYDGVSKLTTRYTYDAAGNRLSEKQSYAADAARRPERLQNNVMTYDRYNRLLTVKDDLYTLSYTYDLNGNRTSVTTWIVGGAQASTVYNTYDKMNRQLLVNGIANTGDINKDLGKNGHLLAYDQLGNRTKDSYTGKRASDGSVGITAETFEYDGAGRLSAVNRDDWLIDQRDYDAVGRVSRAGMIDQPILLRRKAIEKLGLDLQTRSYAYDVGGHVIRQNDRYWNRPDLDIFYVQDPGEPLGGYDAMGNLRGYVVVTEFPQEGDKGYYTINYDWLDGPKEVSTQLKQHGKITMTGSTLDTYGRRISSVTPEGKVSEFFYDADGHVQAKTIDGKAAFNLIVNGQVLGEEDKNLDNVMGSTYETATATALTAPPAMYRVVGDNETLEGIAQALWGERNLWYLIGDANNLDRSAKLKAGDALRVPTRSNSVYNDSDSFKPYDASEQLGNTAPTMAPPKPPKKGGCGVIGQVIMVVVAVVVTWITAGAAVGAVTSAMTTLGASTAVAGAVGTVVGSAIGAAVGSIASQGVGIAIGAQDGFNWKAVGLAAIGGGVTAGIGVAFDTGTLGSIFAEQGWQGAAARAVLSNTLSQGIANITGLQHGFNWRSVVASGVGAAAGSVAAGALKGDNMLAKITAGNELAQRSAVGFIAGTATALARGGKIDVVTIATDAFGNALGESLKDQIHSSLNQSSGASGGGRQGGMGAYVGPEDEDPNAIGPNPGNTRDRSRFISTVATTAKEEARYKQELAAENGWYDDGLVCKPIRSIDENGQRLVNATGDGLSGAQRYLRDNGFTDRRAGTLEYNVGRRLIEDIGIVGAPEAAIGLIPTRTATVAGRYLNAAGDLIFGEQRMARLALDSELKVGISANLGVGYQLDGPSPIGTISKPNPFEYGDIELSKRHLIGNLSIPKKTGNTLFLGTREEAMFDLTEIRWGLAARNGESFTVSSGRTWGMHNSSIHPISGNSVVNVTSQEYNILVQGQKQGIDKALQTLDKMGGKNLLSPAEVGRTRNILDIMRSRKGD